MTLKANVGKYDGWDSINKAGTSVAVTLGTVFEAQARQYFPDAEIKSVEAPARDFQEVLSNRAQVSITRRSRRPGAFLVAQDDQIWLNYVNHWISLKKTQGFFEALEKKWLVGG
jgi:cyclohexadienyl dehydratase